VADGAVEPRGLVAASAKPAAANPLKLVIRTKEMSRDVGGIKNVKMIVDPLAE
jgi:hypothetical protein